MFISTRRPKPHARGRERRCEPPATWEMNASRCSNVDARASGTGAVHIDVAFTGIRDTDSHIVHGAMDRRVALPAVLGHEMSGTVCAVGRGVEGWSPGDRVTVMPLDWCGTCPACLAGSSYLCQQLNFLGIDSPGSMQPPDHAAHRRRARTDEAAVNAAGLEIPPRGGLPLRPRRARRDHAAPRPRRGAHPQHALVPRLGRAEASTTWHAAYGAASACAAGDTSAATLAEVEALVSGSGARVKR